MGTVGLCPVVAPSLASTEAILAAAAENRAVSIALVGSLARAEDSEDSDCDWSRSGSG